MSNKFQHSLVLMLASSSPRRAELLKYLQIPFRILSATVNEEGLDLPPGIFAQLMSLRKAYGAYELTDRSARQHTFIIGADTVVSIGEQVFRRPKSILQATNTLLALAGKKHLVTTGVSLLAPVVCQENVLTVRTFAVESWVEFGKITPEILDIYLSQNEWGDKAGSYGIQGAAQLFIKGLKGSYSNVVGLPLQRIIIELDHLFGVTSWREYFKDADDQ